ncbi:AAA family ATPase [Actinoplanes sp. TRM 88003]|uniref:AAA family ATPase n=1 Tax=Paractinoplanes aksuensis TaxID=2939490 RepID=A0ABT1DH67_9ACTN|nr:AAA family ATPase [Actinoplanes aksuensis]MCO8270181.1 AAA family ATPase [Actinoplanes aksuensis]
MPTVTLRGRRQELAELDRLLADLRAGRSRVLVLRGEAGAGKTALLDHLCGAAPGPVVRSAGVESETEIAYAALQQLCAPLMHHLDQLPEPQRSALSVGFGLAAGDPPDALLVGLAVLSLFAEAAADGPLVCVVDDAQWLDRMSEVILTFVARRLDAESVALVFAARSPSDEQLLAGLPEMPVTGLSDADARALLDTVLPGPIDERVRDRIVAETQGNPLALLELPRGLGPAELAFGFGGPGPVPMAGRLDQGFQRRIAELPPETRTLLVAAALEPVGDVPLLWRALERLGIAPEAAGPAQVAGLVEIGARVRFRHPLVRSASWQSAEPATLRAVHRALADVIDPHQEPDRRAWHRAHAAAGPDEAVAAELERSAGRALSRGGRSAAAAFLERAAELSSDPKPRATRALAAARAHFLAGVPARVPDLLAAAEIGPLDPLAQAGVERLRAQAAFWLNHGRDAARALVTAARRLEELDLAAARETYLSALGAALHTGRLGDGDARLVAEAARAVAPGDDPAGLLLTGLTSWVLDDFRASLGPLTRALAALDARENLNLVWIGVPVAHELFDDEAWDRLTAQAAGFARETGVLSVLPSMLTFRAGALVHAGRLAEAAELVGEADTLGRATGLVGQPSAPFNLLAYRGAERPALDLMEPAEHDARTRAEGRLLALVGHNKSVLYNGLGRYPEALAAARPTTAYADLGFWHWGLGELIEAAARSGAATEAAEGAERLRERTSAAGTPWAAGVQALADALAGPGAQTEKKFREAIELLPAERLSLMVARARLLFGEWLRRDNRRAEARTELRSAYDAFSAMGAAGFAERAGRELTATGETVRKRGPEARDELTPQESQIARLAAAGRTNPEIGAVLFLSPRTVEWHLRKVFGKLGVTSRRELAGAL